MNVTLAFFAGHGCQPAEHSYTDYYTASVCTDGAFVDCTDDNTVVTVLTFPNGDAECLGDPQFNVSYRSGQCVDGGNMGPDRYSFVYVCGV